VVNLQLLLLGMKQYKLIAINEAGASVEYTGDTIEGCKKQFTDAYTDIENYVARIYDHYSSALLQIKPMGDLTYSKA
jgi:hypothetical protein